MGRQVVKWGSHSRLPAMGNVLEHPHTTRFSNKSDCLTVELMSRKIDHGSFAYEVDQFGKNGVLSAHKSDSEKVWQSKPVAAGVTFGLASSHQQAYCHSFKVSVPGRDYTVVTGMIVYQLGFCVNRAGIQIRAGQGAEDEKGNLRADAQGVNATGDVTDIAAVCTHHFSANKPDFDHFWEESTKFRVSMFFQDSNIARAYVIFGPPGVRMTLDDARS